MAAAHDEIKALGAEVVVIGTGTAEQARQYARRLRLPYPVAADTGRAVYTRYGLKKVLLSLIQRSGVFLVDGKGIIRYAHVATNPAASLDLAQLLGALRRLVEH